MPEKPYKKPEMILFDYGSTLLCEPGFDFLRGEVALFKYVKNNKHGLTPEQVTDFSKGLYEKLESSRELGIEMHEWQYQRFMYEYLGIELSIPCLEAEIVFWTNASDGMVMPNADKMIGYINANGIRSGVISNIIWSGAALTDRINRLIPCNEFEFVIASSDYMFRKPEPMLFELAIRKAGLTADKVWFCGDNIKADIEGASAVGIFPVWYENLIMEDPWRADNNGAVPGCDHLHIHDWNELIEILEGFA